MGIVGRSMRSALQELPPRRLQALVLKEHRSPFRYESPRLLRHGFLSESRHIYDFDRYGLADYVSDFERFVRSPRILDRLCDIVDNKLCFDLAFRPAFEARLPPLLGLLVHGSLYRSRASSLRDLARQHGDVVIKPIAGGGGSDVLIVHTAGDHTMIDGNRRGLEYLEEVQARAATRVVQGFVEQCGWANGLYPKTTNTIRVLTLHDPEAHEVFPVIAVQRIGTSASYPVDNWTRGGLSSEINLESGALSKATQYPKRGELVWHSSHPETGVQIEGCIVPGWRELVEVVVAMADHIPLPYVGWDVIVGDEGPIVIEGNSYSDLNLLQVHRPLLADPRVRRAFEQYGVVERRSR